MRLDLALIRLHPQLSRRRARAAIEKGQVSVDGACVREAGHPVPADAVVAWNPHRKALPRARCSLPILYEDEHVLVVDKPAGLLTVPTSTGARKEDTALARVQEYVLRLHARRGFVGRVHRIDRDTSGAVAFALSREGRAELIRAFRAHRIDRCYLAIVAGTPRLERGVVEAPIRDAWVSGRRALARLGDPQKPARTRWHVRELLAGAALLEVELDTGRQHQIRLHLAHVKLPILGDRAYGIPALPRAAPSRPMLHAWRLGFRHPVSGERVLAESPIPGDLRWVLSRLRGASARPAPSPSGT